MHAFVASGRKTFHLISRRAITDADGAMN